MTLENTGERQVAPTLDGIRRDHTNRYEFAAKYLQDNIRSRLKVIDFACGVGYGCRILADAGHRVDGCDICKDALDYAIDHYLGESGIIFRHRDANNPKGIGQYGAAISFETIEHLKDPRPLLLALREAAPLLIASVPNEDVMPFEPVPGVKYAFHHRHYTKAQFKALLNECGWYVTEWYGQVGPESEVEPNCNGRTLIAVCRRDELPERREQPAETPATQAEKHICILGLGPSVTEYLELTKRLGGRHKIADEVWAINALGNVFDCDLVFHMDDVRIQQIRSEAKPDSNIAVMLDWLKTSRVPVVTSRAHPDYPALREFPLEDVLNTLGYDYFNNTGAYAVAYAIYSGATKISLFGMDYTYPNVGQAERGRACVEFWLGFARAHGIDIRLPTSTSLLDSQHVGQSRLYGYDGVDILIHEQPDGTVRVGFTEKTELPTAEQIEKNYDHSAPINEQHLRIS
jgi:SAM-dependent methyltransferase